MLKPSGELVAEATALQDELLGVRREVWRRGDVTTRDVIDTGMRTADFLCKLSVRTEKERDADVTTWLKQTRRSMRAMLREYWTDVIDQRRAVYLDLTPEIGAQSEAIGVPSR